MSPQTLKVYMDTDNNGYTEVTTDLDYSSLVSSMEMLWKLKLTAEQRAVSRPFESTAACFQKILTIMAFPRPMPYNLLSMRSWNPAPMESYHSIKSYYPCCQLQYQTYMSVVEVDFLWNRTANSLKTSFHLLL